MKMRTRKFIAILASATILVTGFTACGTTEETPAPAASAAAGSEEAATADEPYKITFIAMDSQDEHWLKAKEGAEAAAAELGNVEFTFAAPQTKVDATVQAQLVDNAVVGGADAILLAPLDKEALVPSVDKAREAGVTMVIIDASINTEYDAFYSTDNAAAAEMAADELARLIGGKGQVAIVNAQAGAGTAMLREQAFRDKMAADYPEVEIVGVQYSEGDKQKALNYANDFMTQYPDLAGFYGCNEGSAVGVGNAVDQAGKSETLPVVAFDYSADTKALLEKGAIDATMVQNPYEMGYQGMMAAVDILEGNPPAEKDVDTGVTLVNKDNMDEVK